MSRPLCDPIDTTRILGELAQRRTTPLKAYREYASEAARPYARSTFEQILDRARKGSSEPNDKREVPQIEDASSDMASDAHWAKFLPVKPRVLTTVHDNTALRVKGGALIVCDGEHRVVYEAGARKPQAIVMTGWSGVVTVEAVRFACDHNVATVLLDWNRDFLTIVGAGASQSAHLIRAQVLADPVSIAWAVVANKIAAYARAGAISAQDVERHNLLLRKVGSVADITIIEAQSSRQAWEGRSVPSITWRGGSPRIPSSWKLPYSARRSPRSRGPQGMGKSPRHAVHPVNALLNVAFSVTAGRLTALLQASGACPAIGFLHSDKPGRWSLAWDTIEPLRPMIEDRVFRFIQNHQFGSNDFITTNDGHIRLMDNLLKVVIAETAISGHVLNAAVGWIVGLIRNQSGSRQTGDQAGISLPSNSPLITVR